MCSHVDWSDDDGNPIHPVAYSASEYGHGPILPDLSSRRASGCRRARQARQPLRPRRLRARHPARDRAHVRARLGGKGGRAQPLARVLRARTPRTSTPRALSDACSNSRADNERTHAYVTDPEWLADRLVQHIADHATADARRHHQRQTDQASEPTTDDEKEARRQERQRQYEERAAARARNLDLGAALAKWEPKLDANAVKLLGSLVLLEHGRSAAWAHRLCIEQPSTTNKQGRTTVHYPRGAEAENQAHAAALDSLKRARTPEAALAVVLRLLVAQRLADTAGLPNADRQGIYEPRELAGSALLDKLAARVAPPSVKKTSRRAGGRPKASRAGPGTTGSGGRRGRMRHRPPHQLPWTASETQMHLTHIWAKVLKWIDAQRGEADSRPGDLLRALGRGGHRRLLRRPGRVTGHLGR